MHIDRIKSKLTAIYDLFVSHESFEQFEDNDIKHKAMFLGEAEKLLESNFTAHGFQGVYSYYSNDIKFIEFNLNEAPKFSDKPEIINWFSGQILKGREYLGK